MGAASNGESRISSTPPKPGTTRAESFARASRLNIDSTRSPAWPTSAIQSPKRPAAHQSSDQAAPTGACPTQCCTSAGTATAKTMEAATPPANNLILISSIHGKNEQATAKTLFWCYLMSVISLTWFIAIGMRLFA